MTKSESISRRLGHVVLLGSLVRNNSRFDNDLFPVLAALQEGEVKLYLDSIRRNYGRIPPRNICSTTFRATGETSGVMSPTTPVKAYGGLERRGLIKRLHTARSRNEVSMFRVFLPYELGGSNSRTKIHYR